jgi:hypothetical protein
MPENVLWILTNTSPITKTAFFVLRKGTAYISDIQKSVAALSWRRSDKTSFDYFQFKIPTSIKYYDCRCDRFIKFAGNLLTGHIGTASSKY